jgi:hypothetical protein
MEDWKPTVVRGEYLIDLLESLSLETLDQIRNDLGDETFVNSSLVQIVEKTIRNRKRKQSLESLDTISIESPEFWDD